MVSKNALMGFYSPSSSNVRVRNLRGLEPGDLFLVSKKFNIGETYLEPCQSERGRPVPGFVCSTLVFELLSRCESTSHS